MIETVRGPVPGDQLGMVLPHEHLVVDHGKALGRPATPVDAATVDRIVAALARAREHGVRTIVDCTPGHYGRYLDLMAEVSAATDVHIVASTGSFCEAWAPLPQEVTSRDEASLVDEFTRELTEGAGSTRLRAGVIKAATSAPTTAQERKVLRAAGRASRATGAAVVSHTSGGEGLEQLDLYADAGADLSRILVSHVGFEADPLPYAVEVAARGAWVGFDKVGRHVFFEDQHWIDLLRGMRSAGHLDRVLLSHDVVLRFSGPEHVAARTFEDYAYLPRTFLPQLAAAGFSDQELHRLTVDNPRRWLLDETLAPGREVTA